MPQAPQSRFLDATVALLLTFAATPAAINLVILAKAFHLDLNRSVEIGLGLVALVGAVALFVAFYQLLRQGQRRPARIVADILTFLVLPAWGICYSHFLATASCEISSCDKGDVVLRPLAEPALYGLVVLHGIVLIAYAVSRRRSAALPGPLEPVLQAVLVVGLVEHLALAIQFAPWMGYGLLAPPIFLPTLTPLFSLVFLGAELIGRGRNRQAEATGSTLPQKLRLATFARALWITPALLGIYAAATAAWLGGWDAAIWVFTRTCDSPLSRIPLTILPQDDCHYLCTVAARGHPWLVRPLRLGRRRGATILVNRQLAVANAFEDLLHERWPRLGRGARRVGTGHRC